MSLFKPGTVLEYRLNVQDCAYAKQGPGSKALLVAAAHLAHAVPASAQQGSGSFGGPGGFQGSQGRSTDISATQHWPQHWTVGKPGTCSVR